MTEIQGLVAGQRVTLALNGYGLRTAIVDAVGSGEVAVVPMGDESWPKSIDGTPATIEFPGRAGLYRASGTVERGDAGALRFALTGALERIQRREWARAETTRPAQLRRMEDGGDGAIDTWTLDLSAGGARLAGPKGLQIGDRIVLRIRLDDVREIAVEAVAEVARETEDGHIGVRIEEITETDRQQLVKFVFEQQRHMLRVARER
jgi:hypothetical protein